MRLDLKCKPYEAMRVWFWGKCQSPSDVENAFKWVEWRHSMSEQRVVMSLLIWCSHIPSHFDLSITFSSSWIHCHVTCLHNSPCNTCEPLQLLVHNTHLVGPITNHTIRLALHMECTCDLQTLLLHFPFLIGPCIVFWWYFLCFTLPILDSDTWQLWSVAQLTLSQSEWSQVIAPCG